MIISWKKIYKVLIIIELLIYVYLSFCLMIWWLEFIIKINYNMVYLIKFYWEEYFIWLCLLYSIFIILFKYLNKKNYVGLIFWLKKRGRIMYLMEWWEGYLVKNIIFLNYRRKNVLLMEWWEGYLWEGMVGIKYMWWGLLFDMCCYLIGKLVD